MTRIEELEEKLAKRRNQPGTAENVARLERAVTLLKRRAIPLEERLKAEQDA